MASVKHNTSAEYEISAIAHHISNICDILGIDITSESSKDTPKRVAKMYYNELFKNRNNNNIEELNSKMKHFPSEGYQGEIKIQKIDFHSVCEHHWLPFSGTVQITYAPSDKILGLSKFPRVVKYFSQKPQLQERLTREIGEYLDNILNPLWIKVEVVATHSCVACRGAESDCETYTVFKRGM